MQFCGKPCRIVQATHGGDRKSREFTNSSVTSDSVSENAIGLTNHSILGIFVDMKLFPTKLTRRAFLQLGLMGAGAVLLRPWQHWDAQLAEWPENQKLGRNCVGGTITLRKKPSAASDSVKTLYEDSVVVWLREVIGEAPAGRLSRTWVETPEGFLYLPSIQPVYNLPNKPVTTLPEVLGGSDHSLCGHLPRQTPVISLAARCGSSANVLQPGALD
jgi:hypothetical protein